MIVNGNKLLIKKNTLTTNQTFTPQIYKLVHLISSKKETKRKSITEIILLYSLIVYDSKKI